MMILLNTGVVIISIWICQIATCKGENSIICEGDNRNITCPYGKINIKLAIYGRTVSGEPCYAAYVSNVPANLCAVQVHQLGCNFKQSCELLPANGVYPYPSDPCPGTMKYLNVTYTCITEDNTSTVTETTTDDGTSTLSGTTTDGGTSALTGTTTKDDTSTFTETTVDGGNSALTETMAGTSQYCHCPCSAVGSNPWQYLLDLGLTQSEIREVMKPYLGSLERNISIDIKNTSKRQRLKTSVSDDRKSAKSIGYVGLAIIVTIAFILVFIDFLNFFKPCKRPKRS